MYLHMMHLAHIRWMCPNGGKHPYLRNTVWEWKTIKNVHTHCQQKGLKTVLEEGGVNAKNE